MATLAQIGRASGAQAILFKRRLLTPFQNALRAERVALGNECMQNRPGLQQIDSVAPVKMVPTSRITSTPRPVVRLIRIAMPWAAWWHN